jgi:hypothetical protein
MKIKFHEGSVVLNGTAVSVAGMVMPLVKSFRADSQGTYVVVDGTPVTGMPDGQIRVKVSARDSYEAMPDNTPVQGNAALAAVNETDDDIKKRLRARFDLLSEMTKAVKRGDVRALIVSGPPGVGKSQIVEDVLERYSMLQSLGAKQKHEVIKGAMSPIGLYCKLYKFADKDNVIVFDDCDSIFTDEVSLNILKAALDSKPKRTIHWNTESHKLRNEGVPDQFQFAGSVIFITNIKFGRSRGKIRDHMDALESRCHYIDLTIDTEREKMLRIQQVVDDGMLDKYGFAQDQIDEIMEYVDVNKRQLRELSLRTVIKTADLVRAFPNNWRQMANVSLLKN